MNLLESERRPAGKSERSEAEICGSVPAFLRALFRFLDQHNIRYCVLHSFEGLPNTVGYDLHLAVHPSDSARLALVSRALTKGGYQPVQLVNDKVNGFRLEFIWFNERAVQSIGVDIIFEYREPGLETIAERLFGRTWKRKVVDACAAKNLGALLKPPKTRLWRAMLSRDPFSPFRYYIRHTAQFVRCWFQPSGLFLSVLGPDGAGKSSMIEGLLRQVENGPFRRHRLFHSRPMLLWRRKKNGPVTDPHGHVSHSVCWSTARLFAYVLDHWLGYWLVVRPCLARNTVVVFDRYFDDLLADPKRWRYGGPMWLVRVCSVLVPRPDLMLALDAPEEVVYARKQELTREELRRQRERYLDLASHSPEAHVIDAAQPLVQVVAEAVRVCMEYLTRRFIRRHPEWIEVRSGK